MIQAIYSDGFSGKLCHYDGNVDFEDFLKASTQTFKLKKRKLFTFFRFPALWQCGFRHEDLTFRILRTTFPVYLLTLLFTLSLRAEWDQLDKWLPTPLFP